MRLLVVRGDLLTESSGAAVACDYSREMANHFDRVIGVDLHSSSRQTPENFPYELLADEEARCLVTPSNVVFVLSITAPDGYAAYADAINIGLTLSEPNGLAANSTERQHWLERANSMDALWVPSEQLREILRSSGVSVPVRVIPRPIRVAPGQPGGLPDGEVYALDRRPFITSNLLAWLRSSEDRLPGCRWLAKRASPRMNGRLLTHLRCPSAALEKPGQRAFLCVAENVAQERLMLLLGEWLKFKSRTEGAPWSLILKIMPADSQSAVSELVNHLWEYVQTLKRKLGVLRADVHLWPSDLNTKQLPQLVANTFGHIAPGFGDALGDPAALALGMGKPIIAPRHGAFADAIAADYPYAFATLAVKRRIQRNSLGLRDRRRFEHIPEPMALSQALSRLVTDRPERRAESCWLASARFLDWCGPRRVSTLLAEEIERLHAQSRRRAAA
jgi:glycosyltransferase involved in cell wall biosynthesis